MTKIVHVERVHIPMMSSIGHAYGKDDEGNEVIFSGDHRPMRWLGEQLEGAEEPIAVEVEDWQVHATQPIKNVTPKRKGIGPGA